MYKYLKNHNFYNKMTIDSFKITFFNVIIMIWTKIIAKLVGNLNYWKIFCYFRQIFIFFEPPIWPNFPYYFVLEKPIFRFIWLHISLYISAQTYRTDMLYSSLETYQNPENWPKKVLTPHLPLIVILNILKTGQKWKTKYYWNNQKI